MAKGIVFLTLLFTSALSFADYKPTQECYKKAQSFAQSLHKLALQDFDFEGGVNQQPAVLSYERDVYALDNFEEKFTFTIKVGNNLDGFTDLVYKVNIETWMNAEGKAYICDVLSFSHNKEF